MADQPTPEIALLRATYAAFNARDIDAALVLMTPDVAWPRAFKGGFVRGPEEVRAYWTEQWSEIDPHVEPVGFHAEEDGRILVDVHQVVRDLAGALLADVRVGHRFTLAHGLIQRMEVGPLPSSTPETPSVHEKVSRCMLSDGTTQACPHLEWGAAARPLSNSTAAGCSHPGCASAPTQCS